ncbi:MAG: hypothetical protein DRP45_01105 [Candidatus Zixiibacteriota bacterium]|nr:MAG: hypothetical protein DRP45_01105 [candidate division Zixibacteria bacterium]
MPSISDRELKRLRASVDELSALNQIATAINMSMSVDKITRVVLDCCLKKIRASQGAVFLVDDDRTDIDNARTFVRESIDEEGTLPFHLHKSLLGWMTKNKALLVMNEPDSDSRFAGSNFQNSGIKSVLAAPLITRSGLIGLLVLFNSEMSDGFNENDKRFLGIVGTQTARVIENARLFEKEQQLQALEEEMKVASTIQRGLLPRKNISENDYELVGFNEPAKAIGGDYYDMLRLSNERVFIAVGDVSGKGVPAALLAAKAQAVVRSLLQTGSQMPMDQLVSCLNNSFWESTQPEQFVTAFMAIYDSTTRKLQYVSAGHTPPYVVSSNGVIRTLTEGNLIVGVVPDTPYITSETVLEAGETLAVYTDGVTECFSPESEEYGESRLEAFLSGHATDTPEILIDTLVSELADFRSEATQSDDITLLLLKAK